ncbi:MAG: hypothetical protein AAGN15_03840 [Cyanobacteria bacterium J06581_3]
MRSFKLRSFIVTALGVLLLVTAPNYYADAQLHYARTNPRTDTHQYAHHQSGYDAGRRNRGYHAFGEPGRNGSNGRNGRSASTASRYSTIRVTGDTPLPAYYDVSGTNGNNGENGSPGEPARYCRVPRRPPYSLQGAKGGNGGSGGNGGNASNGKNVDIYYTDEAMLSQITVDARGGVGGRGGQGAYGEDGCACIEPEWVVNFCEWQLLSRTTVPGGQTPTENVGDEDAGWTLHSTVVVPCTGVQRVDERENTPPLPSNANQPNTAYRWVYQGVTQAERFHCRDGEDGTAGENGQTGRNGQYGSFRLIPRMDIPTESGARRGELGELIGRNLQLAKNIWVTRQDLRSKLNSASNIPSSYTFLKSTARPQFRLDWTAEATPESLGVATTEVGASVAVQGERASIVLDIPGTLDYTTAMEGDVEVATITGGFSPSRVQSFRIEGVETGEDSSRLILVDEGDIRGLIPRSEIEVVLLTKQSASGLESPDYQERHRVDFVVTPTSTGLINSNINVAGNRYMLDLQRYFDAWLKPGYEARYRVNIQQTTNAGAVYEQSEEIEFQVQRGA